ncbi:helix-turn-helix transcriptional regulator [Sphingomonas colocasiae]|uniref:LuxR C-terminal-related transcriptional regulator n=1 Tax=Sphingomonas colocasiae TaxID=1848973 RepID=A0ABS7PUI8_9SPHN|nr:LuxR family transcriptional regulator [Sphingomonas colocasiae]MBY8825020.1 LuxR C-terminal-related transcriptional regulator [Sphingomonas colocasiae]
MSGEDEGLSLAEHLELCGDFVGRIGAPDFFDRTIASLCRIGNYDLGEAIVFRKQGGPRPISSRLQLEGRRIAPEIYFSGFYRDDPIFRAYMDGAEPGFYRIRDLAPNLRESAYFHEYYAGTRISEEIDFLFPSFDGFAVVIWLGSHDYGPHPVSPNPAAVAALEPVLRNAIERHVELAGSDAQANVRRTSIERSIEHAFDHFGSSIISEREREVLRHTLRGYSAALTAERLGISVGTVKNHRKNIHRKLEIGSQAELLSLFLHALPFTDDAEEIDPLAAYEGTVRTMWHA